MTVQQCPQNRTHGMTLLLRESFLAVTVIQTVVSDQDRDMRVRVKGTETQADWVILAPGWIKGKNDRFVSSKVSNSNDSFQHNKRSHTT